MQDIDFTYSSSDGTEIFVYGWLCDDPKAIVHINHGMAEHAARYRHLAASLCDAGYTVYAQDHRGHGKSIPSGTLPGHFADEDGWNKAVNDAYDVNQMIAKRHPGLPILGLGHSMGSFMVQQILFQKPAAYAAAALSASNGKPSPVALAGRVIARVERRRLGKRGASPVIARMTFGEFNRAFAPNRTGCDWLSRDPEQVDLYDNDPLCGFTCSTQTWIDFLDALPSLTKSSNIARINKSIPLYVFSGDKDPVGENGAGVERLVKSYSDGGLRNIRLKLYPEGRHEMVNETNRQEVVQDIVQWCDEASASLG